MGRAEIDKMTDYYYYATAGGARFWVSSSGGAMISVSELTRTSQWKKYLTTLQITQFIIDICIVYFASESRSDPFQCIPATVAIRTSLMYDHSLPALCPCSPPIPAKTGQLRLHWR